VQPAPTTNASPPLADPTPLGLICLSIGCAALLPIAFGVKAALTPDGIRLAAVFCLLFGAGGQILAGLMSFVNKNGVGGTLFTAFSFNWVMNWWSLSELAQGKPVNTTIVLAVDVCFLVIFVAMTVAFGFYSKLLAAFLADIVVLYLARVVREVAGVRELGLVIAAATVVLMGIALYIAFALVLQTAAGRPLLPLGGPLFTAAAPSSGSAAP
jgi:succinate-acetate transporter protein